VSSAKVSLGIRRDGTAILMASAPSTTLSVAELHELANDAVRVAAELDPGLAIGRVQLLRELARVTAVLRIEAKYVQHGTVALGELIAKHVEELGAVVDKLITWAS
jgi:hypothetical protein